MACKTCSGYNDLPVFDQVTTEDGEYYIEDKGGSWSIITPTTDNIVNLTTNPSLEVDATDYSGGTRTTEDAYSGAYSYKFGTGTVTIPVVLDTDSCVSFMLKTCCDSSVRVRTYPAEIVAVGYAFDNYFESVGNGCWQQISMCFKSGGGTVIGPGPHKMDITIPGCENNYIDLVTSVSGTTPAVPFDGSEAAGVGYMGTPYNSTSLMFGGSKLGGTRVRLWEDLGFRVIAYSGHGVPPVNLPTTPYARRSGAKQQRPLANSRNITITGEICACNWRELSQARLALIDALNLNLDGTCKGNRTMTLQYDCLDECGETVGEPVRIEVSYTGGLDGQRTRPFCERISLSFQANNDPFFLSPRQHCKVIPPNTDVTVNNGGNAATNVMLYAKNFGTSTNLVSITNKTNNGVVSFGSGSGYSVPSNTYAIFRNYPGGTQFRQSDLTTLNNVMNVSNNSKPSLFNLSKGDNVIRIDGSVAGAGSEFVLCWREKHLSSDSACKDCE